jgi:hypothetical protein
MRVGMLWFDDSSRTMPEKVQRAATFYRDKFGRNPNLCLVNPESCDIKEGVIAGVELRQARMVLPEHLWIGVDEEARPKQAEAARASRRTGRRSKAKMEGELRLPLFVDEQAA